MCPHDAILLESLETHLSPRLDVSLADSSTAELLHACSCRVIIAKAFGYACASIILKIIYVTSEYHWIEIYSYIFVALYLFWK